MLKKNNQENIKNFLISNLSICICRRYPSLRKALSHLSPSIVGRFTLWHHILYKLSRFDGFTRQRQTRFHPCSPGIPSHRPHSSPSLQSALHSTPCSLAGCCLVSNFERGRPGSQVTCSSSAILRKHPQCESVACITPARSCRRETRDPWQGPGRGPRLDSCPALRRCISRRVLGFDLVPRTAAV